MFQVLFKYQGSSKLFKAKIYFARSLTKFSRSELNVPRIRLSKGGFIYPCDNVALITIKRFLGIIYKSVYVNFIEMGLCISLQTTYLMSLYCQDIFTLTVQHFIIIIFLWHGTLFQNSLQTYICDQSRSHAFIVSCNFAYKQDLNMIKYKRCDEHELFLCILSSN